MADLAKLVVRLEAQSAQLLTELDRASRGITGFATKTSREIKKWATGLASAYTIAQGIGFAKEAINNADAMGDMAQAAGQSVEDFSRMAYAMKGANIEGNELVKVQTKLASQAVDAANGSKKAAAGWKALGIDVRDANGEIKNGNTLILEAADAFAQYADGPAKTALAVDMFGDKLAGKMIPFLNKGREGIEALMKESDKFGQTISGETSAAADQFNDNLDRLAALGRGVANTLVAELLPGLTAMSEEMVGSATNTGALDKAARGLAIGLKILVTGGMLVGEVFDRVGDAIGAQAAAIMAFVQGDFKRAFQIQNDYWSESKASLKATVDEIAALWKTTGDNIAAEAESTDEKLKKTLVFGGGVDPLQEVTITAKKIEVGAMQQFYDELNDMTKTSSEQALAEYHRQTEAVKLLYKEGVIGLEAYEARRKEALDTLLPEFEVTVKKITEKTESTISEFDKAVAQNTVGIIADALTGGFDEGARGILHSFAVMLQQLAAQALAAEIGKKIFGESGGASGGSGGGWWGALVSAAGSFFGGGAATGRSHVSAGTGLIVGENGPEKFVPDVPGRVMSAAEIAPQPQVNVPLQVVNVDDPNKIPAFFTSDKGRQTFMNMLTDNASAVRQVLQGA